MNYFLIYILVVIVFVHNQCDTSPVHSGQDFSFNSIDDRPYSQTKAKSKSSDNSVKSGRTEIKKKTCGQILIETLPMICQHSSDLIETDNDLEYSESYEDYESRNQKTKKNIVEECCVNKCSFQDLINFCNI